MTKESFMKMLDGYMTNNSESELAEKMTIEKAVAFWRLAVWFMSCLPNCISDFIYASLPHKV